MLGPRLISVARGKEPKVALLLPPWGAAERSGDIPAQHTQAQDAACSHGPTSRRGPSVDDRDPLLGAGFAIHYA
jgi:hypothetical protein